jgi:hypothetical protein
LVTTEQLHSNGVAKEVFRKLCCKMNKNYTNSIELAWFTKF